MMELSFDPKQTLLRKQALEKYFKPIFTRNQFKCEHIEVCRSSHPGTYYEGQLHHIGYFYDAYAFSHPYRIMVVGQEYGGGPSLVDMDLRHKQVAQFSGTEKTFKERNPHMRGTTSILRLLFGLPLGSNFLSEFCTIGPGKKVHIFEMFALVDYLLCSAVPNPNSTEGKSTPIMRNHCMTHFKAAVEILEPSIVIVQTKKFWNWIVKAFENVIPITETLFQSTVHGNKVMIASFTHPSAHDDVHNWGQVESTPYLMEIVVPTVERIKQELLNQ